ALLFQILIIQIGHPYADVAGDFRMSVVDNDQATRVSKRQRSQQRSIDQAEDDRVGADPERQCHDSNQCKAGILKQHSQAVAKILQYSFQLMSHSYLLHAFFDLFFIAQLDQGRTARLRQDQVLGVQPRSLAILLKLSVATTLLAAPRTQTVRLVRLTVPLVIPFSGHPPPSTSNSLGQQLNQTLKTISPRLTALAF